MLHGTSKCNREHAIYLTPDLEACHDRQLPALGGMVEEAIRVNRKVIKVFLKMIESLRHRFCTILVQVKGIAERNAAS